VPSILTTFVAAIAVLALAPPARAEDDARDLGLVLFDEWPKDLPNAEDGIPIRWAVPKSPAAQAGFKPGDLLLNIDLYAVTREGLAKRWIEKSTGAAGCIDMSITRTELKSKNWKDMKLCVPVQIFAMPENAALDADAAVPLAIVSGDVENAGTYVLSHTPLMQILADAKPAHDGPLEVCVMPRGPQPLPPGECGSPSDPKWKKFPKTRTVEVKFAQKGVAAEPQKADAPPPANSGKPSGSKTVDPEK
jgi:hypothetical protein